VESSCWGPEEWPTPGGVGVPLLPGGELEAVSSCELLAEQNALAVRRSILARPLSSEILTVLPPQMNCTFFLLSVLVVLSLFLFVSIISVN